MPNPNQKKGDTVFIAFSMGLLIGMSIAFISIGSNFMGMNEDSLTAFKSYHCNATEDNYIKFIKDDLCFCKELGYDGVSNQYGKKYCHNSEYDEIKILRN